MSNVIVVPNTRSEVLNAMGGLVEAISQKEWAKAAYIKAIWMDLYDSSVPSPARTADEAVAELLKGFKGFEARTVRRYRNRFDKTFPELKDSFGFGDKVDVTDLDWDPIYNSSEQTLKVVIAETATEARDQIIQIDSAANLGQWHKAAICYAYRAKHYDIIGDARAAGSAAADELDTDGYGEWTIANYANRWRNAGMPDVRPGDEVEISDSPWEPIQGGANRSKDRMQVVDVEATVAEAKTDPDMAKKLADAVVSIPEVATAVAAKFTKPKPQPTELRPIEDQFASVRVLWEHTIKRVEAEGGVALADEMREIRDRMKQIEKSVTGKRFRR